jgi:hypothetical protein
MFRLVLLWLLKAPKQIQTLTERTKNEKAGPIFHFNNFGHCINGVFGNDAGNRQIQW